MKPEDIAGPAAVKALTDAGYTLVPPKEPARIVTMEESRGRYARVLMAFGNSQLHSDGQFEIADRNNFNAADDWLVKTVNRRIVEGLPDASLGGFAFTGTHSYCAYRPDLLRIFTGEAK